MATKNNQVDVNGTPTLVVPVNQDFENAFIRKSRFSGPNRYITVKNIGPSTVFLGGTDVATDTGIPINSGGSFIFWLGNNDEIWALTSGSLATVSYIETGGMDI